MFEIKRSFEDVEELVMFAHSILDVFDSNETVLPSDFKCVFCNKNTLEIGHYYMVTDDLWKQAGVGNAMLCLNCLQERAGRKLVKEDFKDVPLNEGKVEGWLCELE